MAAVLQGSLLVRFSPPEVADVFCASRLGASYDGTFGALAGGGPARDHRARDAGGLTPGDLTFGELLGPAADVSDDRLAAMVADLLHEDRVEAAGRRRWRRSTTTCPAITTGGALVGERPRRARRPARRRTGCSSSTCRPGSGHPFFQFVPEEAREMAAASVPWQHRGGGLPLRPRRPAAGRADRCPGPSGVFDLDELSAAIWLEEVPVRPATWDHAPVRAGGPAAGPALRPAHALAPLAALRDLDWTMATYADRPARRARCCRCCGR